MANKKNGTIYIGVTNNLVRRVHEHKQKLTPGFTSRYGLNRLVYSEDFNDIRIAIAREKQIKGWLRKKKLTLIESMNPEWNDLSEGWYEQ
jgi:putative endonuclease